MFNRIIIAIALAAVSVTGLQAQENQSLDQLLREVQRAATQESAQNRQRIQRFQQQRDQQRQLLQQARARLAEVTRQGDALKAEFDENERVLAEAETLLQERMGNLGEMFGVVRQVADDVRGELAASLTSAQFPNRDEFLANLAQRKELPTIPELRRLWYEMQREITEQGKIVSFQADVLNPEGRREENQGVTRIGVFNALNAEGKFLQYRDDERGGVLVELPRQPAGSAQDLAASYVNAAAGSTEPMAIDPTRGAILSLVVQSPSFEERIRQGGEIGAIIIVLGILGLLFSIFIGIRLLIKGIGIRGQLGKDTPKDGNALGRIMKVYSENPDADVETLELKLDEQILKETGRLESGLPIIKVLYVVAPLLGLLGTVVGMIETFQQITLFGTGDPKTMAGGISKALMTTVLGLCVAIPLTLIHSFLQSYAQRLIHILEEQSAGIIAKIAERR